MLLFSGGKDSVVVLHLAAKAFWPARVPFPVLHVDTGHNFPEVLDFRDRTVERLGLRLEVAAVQDYVDDGRLQERADGTRNPLQTQPLLDAIAAGRHDAVFGGARRDEDKARAKERILSLRDEFGQWDPRNQRPELWDLYNGRHTVGQHVRAFPISNWTELDVWRYIEREGIELPPLYYAHEREVYRRDGMWRAVSDVSPARADEIVERRTVRYRTVGDMSCTGAVESDAADVACRRRRGRDLDPHRARRDPRRRPHLRGRHGGPQEGRVLLMTLFRFATAGSVDDGKSTLVGRLLHDSKAILADQLESVARTSAERGFGGEPGAIDFALLTDGLRAEREQGITIDVAYRYFTTGRRSFILADCPGHVQYTRNMVTGATTADAVVVLVDARNGVLEQTRRHLAVVQLLRVPHVIVAVNKIDLLGYSETAFTSVADEVTTLARELGLPDAHVIPVSALAGDNVVERSANTPWYDGPSLLELLETLPSLDELETELEALRMPVQLVIRPQGVARARRRRRRGVPRLPRLRRAHRLGHGARRRPGAGVPRRRDDDRHGHRRRPAANSTRHPPRSRSRSASPTSSTPRAGAVVVAAGALPEPRRELDAALFWLGSRPLRPGARVLVKSGTSTVQALVPEIVGRRDLDSLALEPADRLEVNDIGQVRVRLAADLPVEEYAAHRRAGAFLVIDPQSGATLAAGIVTASVTPTTGTAGTTSTTRTTTDTEGVAA